MAKAVLGEAGRRVQRQKDFQKNDQDPDDCHRCDAGVSWRCLGDQSGGRRTADKKN